MEFASNWLVPGTTISHYEIIKLLGRGGMGEVYLAKDLHLGRNVAVKVLTPQHSQEPISLTRFRREATSAATLNHSNICGIHEIGEANGQVYICMEYVEGTTLRQHLGARPMEIQEVLDIGIQIADALEEARKKNIVHRDIKSGNIMLTERKQVKILDFGLAKPLIGDEGKLSEAPTVSNMTKTGVALGTPAYMSPEQALGKQVDHRSDIFSFGVVLYEMLTGRLPFTGNSTTEVIDAILHKEPVPVARFNEKVPDEMVRVVNKMLEKNPEERYQSVHEVWSDLRRIKGLTTEGTSMTQRVAPTNKRQNVMRWVVVAAAVILTLAAGFLFRKNQSLPPNLTTISSVVALPCKVYGSNDVNYLTDAVPSTLSTILGKVQGLEIKMPPTSLEVEKLKGDFARVAEAYGVSTFVVSSITAESDHLVLNVQLVEARSRRVLWSNDYEGTTQNYIELAKQAAEGLRQAIKPSSSATLVAGLTSSSEAELAFQRGKYFSNRYNNRHESGDFDIAFTAFKHALELDPKLADAAAEIARLHYYRTFAGMPYDVTVPEIEGWARRALQINPRCGRAWGALAEAEIGQPHASMQKMLAYGLRATSFAPEDAASYNIMSFGLDEVCTTLALQGYLKAYRLDPLSLGAPFNAAADLLMLNRSTEGLSLVDEALRIEPDAPFGVLTKSFVLMDLNRLKESGDLSERLKEFSAQHRMPATWLLIAQHAQALQSEDPKAAEDLDRILKIVDDPKTSTLDQIIVIEFVVPFLARHGRKEPTLHILTKGVEVGVVPYDFLMLNPYLKSLQSDSRFQKIVSKSRQQFDEMLGVLQEARSRGEFPQYLEKSLSDLQKQLGI